MQGILSATTTSVMQQRQNLQSNSKCSCIYGRGCCLNAYIQQSLWTFSLPKNFAVAIVVYCCYWCNFFSKKFTECFSQTKNIHSCSVLDFVFWHLSASVSNSEGFRLNSGSTRAQCCTLSSSLVGMPDWMSDPSDEDEKHVGPWGFWLQMWKILRQLELKKSRETLPQLPWQN